MYSNPIVAIYVRQDGQEYLVQRYVEHPEFGYSMATGEPIRLARDVFVRDGSELVASLLSAYEHQHDLGVPSESRMSTEQRRKFYGMYTKVLIDQQNPHMVNFTVIEMDEEGNFGQGRDSATISIAVPFTRERFTEAIDAALRGTSSREAEKGDVPT